MPLGWKSPAATLSTEALSTFLQPSEGDLYSAQITSVSADEKLTFVVGKKIQMYIKTEYTLV